MIIEKNRETGSFLLLKISTVPIVSKLDLLTIGTVLDMYTELQRDDDDDE